MQTAPKLPWVLLPGLLGDREAWAPVLAGIENVHAHCPIYPVSASIAEIGAALLETAPEEFVLAGHSMGGYVALEIMRQQPDRVAGLLLISTQAEADTPEQSAARETLAARAGDEGLDQIADLMAKLCIPKTAPDSAALRERFAAMARRYGTDAFIAHQKAVAGRPSSLPLLSEIDVPAVIVAADDDKIVPAERSFAMAEALPHARSARLDTGGHMPMWTQSGACIAATGDLMEMLDPASDAP